MTSRETIIKGRRIHFTGSADEGVDHCRLKYGHQLVKELAKRLLWEGAGLVGTVGSEPLHNSGLPLIFDWTLLEAFVECANRGTINWPETQGSPLVVVGLPKWKSKIPKSRKILWKQAVSTDYMQIYQVKSGLGIGGVLREHQADFGDILVAMGGGPGVMHLADLYMTDRKPIVPLDIPLKTGKLGAAEELSIRAMEDPKLLRYKPLEKAATAYSKLSLKCELQNINEFAEQFLDFLQNMPKPKAFYIRVLNRKVPEFKDVEQFFRNVVDPLIREAGYERFQSGLDTSEEPFLNVEIFKSLVFSSLVIADLTSLRLNCFVELGYALGLPKRVIITAQEGTNLPFDTAAMPCHFWSKELSDNRRKEAFKEFMKKNIDRRPIAN